MIYGYINSSTYSLKENSANAFGEYKSMKEDSSSNTSFKEELETQKTATSLKPFGEDGFNVWDVIDVINPLQHIPLLASFYRNITGDEMGSAAKVAGDTLYGGVIGAAFSVADIAINAMTGVSTDERVGDTVQYAKNMFSGDSVMLAGNQYDEEKLLTPQKSTTIAVQNEPLTSWNTPSETAISNIDDSINTDEMRDYNTLWGAYTQVSLTSTKADEKTATNGEWLDMDSFIEQSRRAYNNSFKGAKSTISADI